MSPRGFELWFGGWRILLRFLRGVRMNPDPIPSPLFYFLPLANERPDLLGDLHRGVAFDVPSLEHTDDFAVPQECD